MLQRWAFVGEVTALAFSPSGDTVYVGLGPLLTAYSVHDGSRLWEEFVLPRGRTPSSSWSDVYDLDDWVMEARLLDEGLAVGYAHNMVDLICLATRKTMIRVQCCERVVVHGMSLWGRSWTDLHVASGTIRGRALLWNPVDGGRVAETLEGHDGVIFRVRYSVDGQWMASVSDDRTLRLWRRHDPKAPFSCHQIIYGHTSRLWDCQLTSRFVVSVGEDATCHVWDFDGSCRRVMHGHTGRNIWRVAVSPSEALLATGGGDGAVNLWSLDDNDASQTHLRLYPLPEGLRTLCNADEENVICVAGGCHLLNLNIVSGERTSLARMEEGCSYSCCSVGPARELVACGGSEGEVLVVSLTGSFSPRRWRAHTFKVLVVTWVTDGELVTAGTDGEVKVWHMQQQDLPQLEHFFHVPVLESISSVAITRAHDRLACGGARGGVALFHLHPPFPRVILPRAHKRYRVSHVAFDPHTTVLLSCGRDGYIREYDGDLRPMASYKLGRHIEMVERILFAGSRRLFAIFFRTNFEVWNLDPKFRLCSIPCGGGARAWDVCVNPSDLRILFTFWREQKLCVVQSHAVAALRTLGFPFHGRICTAVRILSDLVVAVAGEDETTKIVQVSQGKMTFLDTLEGHGTVVRAMDTCSECMRVYTAGTKEMIQCWRLRNSQIEILSSCSPQNFRYLAIAVCPVKDHTLHCIVTGCSDGSVCVFVEDAGHFHPMGSFALHHGAVLCCTKLETPTGHWVLTGGTDGQVAVWNVSDLMEGDATPLVTLQAHQSGVNCMSARWDAQEQCVLFVSGGDDQALCVVKMKCSWKDYTMHHIPGVHASAIKGVWLHPSGHHLYTCSTDQRVNVFRNRLFEKEEDLQWERGVVVDVGDVAGMDVRMCAQGGCCMVVVGQGMEVVLDG